MERSGELSGEVQNSATGQASSFPHAAARMLPLVIIGLGLNNRVSSEGLLMTAMTKPSLTIPVYDRALHALKSSIVAGMISVDPMLGQIAPRTTGHAGPVRNVSGPNPVDHDWTQFQGDYALHIDASRETDVDAFITAIYGVAEQYAEAIGATLLRTANPGVATSPTGMWSCWRWCSLSAACGSQSLRFRSDWAVGSSSSMALWPPATAVRCWNHLRGLLDSR